MKQKNDQWEKMRGKRFASGIEKEVAQQQYARNEEFKTGSYATAHAVN